MKEIKFRLRMNNRIVGYEKFAQYVSSSKWLYATESDSQIWAEAPIEHNKKDLYINLKDKNIKEIFEGDIIAINYMHLVPAIVEWDEDNAQFILQSSDNISDFECHRECELEIIGNKFENPELLESK